MSSMNDWFTAGLGIDEQESREPEVGQPLSEENLRELYDGGIPVAELLGEESAPEVEDHELGGKNMEDLQEVARQQIENTQVSPALQALFDSGEAQEIINSAGERIKDTEVPEAMREAMDTTTPAELRVTVQEKIAATATSRDNRIKSITSIPKEMMLRVDDLHRRTGLSKKYIMRNLEDAASKAEENEYKEFINTQVGEKTREHLKYPYNQARMKGEFALLKLESEMKELEELGKVHRAYSGILNMTALNPNFNDLQAQSNFWHENFPDGVKRGEAVRKYQPYIDKLEKGFGENQEDYREAYLRKEGMKDSWIPNSAFNLMSAFGGGWANLQNIAEEYVEYFTGSEVTLGRFSGDRYAKQIEMAIEMLNGESRDNWISPEWYRRGRSITQSLLTATQGAAAGGVLGASVLFGADAFAQGVDSAEAAGLEGAERYNYATRGAATEFAFNLIGGKVFGAGVESMLSNMFSDTGKKGLVQAFKDYGKDGVKKAVRSFGKNLTEENIEEIATELTHAVNESESGVDPEALSAEKLLPRIKETVIQSSIMAGTPGAVEVGKALLVNQAHSSQLAKIEQEKRERIKIAVESSELAKKDPVAIENFLERTLPELEAVEVHSDVIVETYRQEAPEVFEEDMKKLGLSPEVIKNGAEIGAKSEISATKIMAQPAGRRLIEKVGLDNINTIGQQSVAESKEAENELAAEVQQLVGEIEEIDKNMRKQSPLLEKMVDTLKLSELFTKKDARKLTVIIDSMFKNLYLNGGLKPDEYLSDIELAFEETSNLKDKMHPDRYGLMNNTDKAIAQKRLEQAAMWNFKGERKEFARKVLSGELKGKAYIELGKEFAFAPDISIQVPSDVVKHVEKSHPGSSDIWNDIEGILGNVNAVEYGKPTKYHGTSFIAKGKYNGRSFGMAVEVNNKGTGTITTVFYDNSNSIKSWFRNQKRVSEGRGADNRRLRDNNRVPSISSDKIIKTADTGTIPHDNDSVNNNPDTEGNSTLEQGELAKGEPGQDSPRGWVDFTNKKKILNLTAKADASTVMHEFMHIYVHDAINLVNSGKASDEFVHNIDALIEFATDGKSNTFVDLDKNAQERIARAFEAYLMEGRAPSTRLAESFDTIKGWMLKVYKTIRNLNVELNDDVRGVFDSMLASKEEIEETRRYYNDVQSYTDLYLADKQRAEELKAMREQENLSAEQKQLKRRMYIWKKLRGGKKGIEKDIQKTIQEEPLYKVTIPAVVKAGGLNTADIESAIGKDAVKKLKKHGKSVIKKSGKLTRESEELFDIAAENDMTVEQFLEFLIDAPSLKEQVSKKAAEQYQLEEQRIREQEGLDDEEIYHTESRLRILLGEYQLIKEMLGGVPSEYQLTMKTVRDSARNIVRNEQGKTASRYYKFSQAEAAAARKARKLLEKAQRTEDAAEKQELQEQAAEEIRRQMLNHAIVLEAVKVRDIIKKVKQRYSTRKIESTTKNTDNSYREVILALAQKFRLMKQNHKGFDLEAAADGLVNEVQVADDNGNINPRLRSEELKSFLPEDMEIPDWMTRTILDDNYKSISDLTVEQIIELDEVLGELIARGNLKLKASKTEYGETIEEFCDSSSRIMKDEYNDLDVPDDKGVFNPSLKHKAQNSLVLRSIKDKTISILRYMGSHMKMMEFLCDEMDGCQSLKAAHSKKQDGVKAKSYFGPMRTLFNKFVDKENEYEDRFNQIRVELLPYLEVLDKAQQRLRSEYKADKFDIDGLLVPEKLKKKRGRKGWDTEMLISCAMNMGNDKNIYALMLGYGFTENDILKVAEQFTESEWLAIQGVWDTINTLYPDLDKVNFSLTNRHLEKEEAQQLTVFAKGGKRITLKGGYYPLGYDNLLANKVAEFKEFDDMLDKKQSNYTAANNTRKGMTKKRLEDKDGNPVVIYPPELSLRNVLDKHLRYTIRTITHAELVKEFDAITRNEDWQDTMISKFGIDHYKALRDWLGYQARPDKNRGKKFEKVFDFARKRNTELALGFRVKTGFKQRLSLYNGINAMGDDGLKYLLRGMSEFGWKTHVYGDMKNDKAAEINKMSSFMNNRQAGVSREVRDYLNRVTIRKSTLKIKGHEFSFQDMKEAAFWWVQANDRAAVYPLWQGAYLKAMETDIAFKAKEIKVDNMSEEEISEAREQQRVAHHKAAVKYADSIVRSSQPSSQSPDLASVQRAEGMMRFFTAFMTFTLKAGNRLSYYTKARKNKKISRRTYFKHIALEWAAPSLTLLSLAMLFYDEEDEPSMSDWVTHIPESMLAAVPAIRNIPAAIRYRNPVFALPGTEKFDDIFNKPSWMSVFLLGEFTLGFPIVNLYRDYKKESKKIFGDKEK